MSAKPAERMLASLTGLSVGDSFGQRFFFPLIEEAHLTDIRVEKLDIPAAFENFDDYWTPFLGGTGSAPKYCTSLSSEAQTRLREKLRNRLPTSPDGEILLAVRAWAVSGRVAHS